MKKIKKNGFTIIEILLSLIIMITLSAGAFVYYKQVQQDSKVQELSQLIISLGDQLNADNLGFLKDDLPQWVKHNIIEERYVFMDMIKADHSHAINVKVKDLNSTLSNSEFKNTGSNLSMLEISLNVSPKECGKIFNLTRGHFKYLKTNRSANPLINEYQGISNDYSLPAKPSLKCDDGNDTTFTYGILFRNKKLID